MVTTLFTGKARSSRCMATAAVKTDFTNGDTFQMHRFRVASYENWNPSQAAMLEIVRFSFWVARSVNIKARSKGVVNNAMV